MIEPSASFGNVPLTAFDVHSHAMPLPLLRSLEARGLADLSALSSDIVRLDPRVSGVGPGAPLPLAPSQYDVPTRLAEMDAMGVSHHAVATPPFLFCSTSDDEQLVRDVIGQGNDELAAYVAEAPDRLVALGSVPVGWPGAADEARRCLDDLGMAGLAIGSSGARKELDDPVNGDFWALVQERDAFVFLHPSGVPDGHRQRDFWMPQLVGYPMETALAVARLILGGIMETFEPTICLAHGGGCVPSIRPRIDMGWERKKVTHTTSVPPSELANKLYYDTAVFSTRTLQRIIEDVGVGQVLLGTDHPFELGDRDPLGTVGALELDESDSTAILYGTAVGLLSRTLPTSPPAPPPSPQLA